MLVVVSYDVSTQDAKGRKRLRQVAKKCEEYGQRVQNSVFECQIDTMYLRKFKHELLSIIDIQADSLRFYNLGNHYQTKTEHYGVKKVFDLQNDVLLL